ncbi:MAG: protein kinase [Chloroflexi bacterium]|nr:protein kinase [Chloroflexota bacterium]
MSTFNNQTGRLSPHSMLQQRYIIAGQAGRGGMGAVYQATDIHLGHRSVAIKEMSQGHLNAEEMVAATQRFQQEAAMLHALSHPNLPRIYDAFSENGRSYLVMDFIDGKTLHQLLREANGQPLPVALVLIYARQLCDVLSYLHQQNPPIIFRDVKPANIMVTQSSQVFLIDFGIARFFKEGQVQDTVLLGSPGYAPPEQHGIAQTNPRSDIYGLGATLHYCLTGRDPYYAQPNFSFPPIRQFNAQVPLELDQLIMRMLAHDERARPANVLEVQQALITISQQASEHTSAFTPVSVVTPASAPTQYIPPTPSIPSVLPNSGSSVLAEQPPTVAVKAPAPLTIPRPLMRSGPATPSSPWSRGFVILFSALLAAIIGGTTWAFNFVPDSAYIVEFILSLILLLISVTGGIMVRNAIARSIAFLVALAALVCGLAFNGLEARDLHIALIPINSTSFGGPEPLLTMGLLAAAVISLCWLLRPFTRTNRIILLVLFGSAAVSAILQPFLPLQGSQNYALVVIRHILLLVALITLIQGVLFAIQAERVSGNTPQGAIKHA